MPRKPNGTSPSGVRMPSTLQRSPAKAQRTYAKTLAAAESEYGAGERAARAAYASLKHSFQKVGDHWEPKAVKGPSDPQAAKSGRAARGGEGATYGGVDAMGETRQALYERAKALGVPGRSAMRKDQLAQAIARKQR
jgi:ChaB